MRRMLTPLGCTGLGLLALVVLAAVVGPLIWDAQATAPDMTRALEGPSAAHWFGTDGLGRDLFARVVVAARLSLLLTLIATAICAVGGLLLGAAPLFAGPRAAKAIVAGVNVLVAFPALLLVLVIATIVGVGTTGAVIAIGLAGAPAFARMCQTLIASVERLDYVSAARTIGVGRLRILRRHVLPNIAEPLLVNLTVNAGTILLAFAGMSFLGLGVQAPSYDWGRLMQDNLDRIYTDPVVTLAPGLAVIIAGLAFNLTGEAAAIALGVRTDTGALVIPAAGVRTRSAAPSDATTVLDVQDLRVSLAGPHGVIRPVRGVSFSLQRGEAVGVVGESGSGKSMTALAIARLVEEPGVVDAARLTFAGHDLLDGTDHHVLLGRSLAMVFQDPMTSFNPAHRVGAQLAEVGRQRGLGRRAAWARAVDRLRAVRLREPEQRAKQHPHEFSGGMRQRAMIAMGLMGTPELIIADEPTSALDVTVQKEILALLSAIRAEQGAALLFITHDVSVVRELCSRMLVMYAGRIVEDLPIAALDAARHPYTRALVAAVPGMETDRDTPLPAIAGQPVDPAQVPDGCAFAARCPLADDRCRIEEPPLVAAGDGRIACWHPATTVVTPLSSAGAHA